MSLPLFSRLAGPRWRDTTAGRLVTDQTGASVIAADLQVHGTVLGTGLIHIAGRVCGDVDVEGQVVVSPGGIVEGDVHARETIVAGAVTGSIVSAERTLVCATATLAGDVITPQLVVQEGARIDGRIDMGAARRGAQTPPQPLVSHR